MIVAVLTLTTGLEFTLGDVFFEVDCSFFCTVFLFCTTGLSDFTDNFWLVAAGLAVWTAGFFTSVGFLMFVGVVSPPKPGIAVSNDIPAAVARPRIQSRFMSH